ncbi:MAG: cysteine--tRNA ligase [Thermoleophilia bacterium]|nr:cysteine--tRNA ligase [Thermoleophilia bacterium]
MQMQVYDTATRKKQPLLAPGSNELSIYVCGPTVYDHIHVGNARTFAMFQVLVNYLRFSGVKVRHVSNITDVNDKIYAAAREQGVSSADLAAKATAWYIEDTNALGLGRPDVEPTASAAMGDIITLIEDLVSKDLAYEAQGDVYFRVARYEAYGKLSNRSLVDMIAGSRDALGSGAGNQDPLDFVLWKATKPDEDTKWDSPWGAGRPGWHVECSAMAEAELGPDFDVHAGGLDLLFPHHENEVAQSRGAGHGFARLWMHGGLLEVAGATGAGEKMSKSLGNFDKLSDVLARGVPGWQLVLMYLAASYRSPLAWGGQGLEQAAALGSRITETLRRSERYLATVETRGTGSDEFSDSAREWEGMHEALRDDFNTAEALKELNGIIYDLNTDVDEHATPQLVRNKRRAITEFLEVFGLRDLIPEDVDVTAQAQTLVEQRDLARTKKDWAESDRLRDELVALGYVVRDTSEGTDLLTGSDEAGDGDEDSGRDARDDDPEAVVDIELDDETTAAAEPAGG